MWGGWFHPFLIFSGFRGEQIRREFNRSMKNDNCACHFLSGNRKNFPLIAHKLSVWVESVPPESARKLISGGLPVISSIFYKSHAKDRRKNAAKAAEKMLHPVAIICALCYDGIQVE